MHRSDMKSGLAARVHTDADDESIGINDALARACSRIQYLSHLHQLRGRLVALR
jgi:hypothetical protein